jgi:DNA-binding NarL/FixJ family response regulator
MPLHRKVTDVSEVGQEVHTPPTAYQPAAGCRPPMPQDGPDARVAIVVGGTDPMIPTSSRLTVVPRGEASAPGPDTAEPTGAFSSANGDNRAGAADARVTTDDLVILALLADGLTLDSVAARVSMSPRTLSRRLRCVCERLGVAHPIQAIVWAARRGLI